VIQVRVDSAIAAPEQLKGARLAIPRHEISIDFWRAMALHGFAGALGLAGLGLGDAELVEVPAGRPAEQRDQTGRAPGQWEAELDSLARGEVDAVYTKGAVALETAARYGAVVGIELDAAPDKRSRVNNGTPRPITVHQRLLDERPDLAVRFLSVLVRASNWAAGNPADVARILAAETGSGAAGVTGAYRHRDLHVDLSPERLRLLAGQEQFLRAHGFLESPVQVPAWADHAPTDRRSRGTGLWSNDRLDFSGRFFRVEGGGLPEFTPGSTPCAPAPGACTRCRMSSSPSSSTRANGLISRDIRVSDAVLPEVNELVSASAKARAAR
jgi:ABC-type nitrate/sulfonate/bicarbonate transport system substrate-binding protein